MDNNVDVAVAIDIANNKIAELNMEIVKNKTEKLENELNKWLTIKNEIYNGNKELIEKVNNNEI